MLVAATTSLILIAFLIPLGYLVQQVAADRAINAATREAEGLAPIVATVNADVLALTVEQLSHDDRTNFPLTVFLPDGVRLGAEAVRSDAVKLAARGESLVADAGNGREVLVAVQGVYDGTAVVRSFVPDAAMWTGVRRAWVILGLLGLVLLSVSIVVADRMARSMVASMRSLAAVSHQLGAGRLDARVSPSGPNELRAVGHAVNQLARRIGELLTAEREAVADHSHRLRTPLTVLRLDAEGLADPAEADQIGADVDALERTVDDIIHEARRPIREGIAACCDATVVVAERVEFFSALAAEEERTVRTDLAAGPLLVRVSAEDLAACADALLGNVFAHTPAGTAFAVRLVAGMEGGRDGATLTVSDDGSGFVTGEPLSRGTSGAASTGLGLDIVRRTAEASGGSVAVSSEPGARIVVGLGPAGGGP